MDNTSPTTPTQPADGGGNNHGDYQSINRFLEKTGTALTNAMLSDVIPLLNARGYAPLDITAKKADVDALRALNEKQKAEYGEQYEATKAYNEARAAAHEDYMDHLELARVAFRKDTAARTALGLRGSRAGSQSGYVGQGLLFYNNALASTAIQAELAKKGITLAELQAGQAAFKALETLAAAQQKETGDAQAVTRQRDKAYDELSEWMSDFYATARVALRKNPQLMEKLGIKDPS